MIFNEDEFYALPHDEQVRRLDAAEERLFGEMSPGFRAYLQLLKHTYIDMGYKAAMESMTPKGEA